METIALKKEMETLLIPLYGKALENRKKKPLLADPKALQIVEHIDYDFSRLKIPDKTNIMMCLRALMFDEFARTFLAQNKNAAVVHLGCGLDSRVNRVDSSADWTDVDFPEVIAVRRSFYVENPHYHMIGSSVTDPGWIDKLPAHPAAALVIAEGLLMYLSETEIRELFGRLKERLGSFTIIFDAFSAFTARHAGSHPSIRKTGAVLKWGIDNPVDMEHWGLGIHFIEEQYFTNTPLLERLGGGMRVMFRFANLFPAARKAQRLVVCRVE